jgi:hypothetical protein
VYCVEGVPVSNCGQRYQQLPIHIYALPRTPAAKKNVAVEVVKQQERKIETKRRRYQCQ